MFQQQETTREHVQALAQQVEKEKKRISSISQVGSEAPSLRTKGAIAALGAIKRDLVNVSLGLWRGTNVTIEEGLRLLYDKWQKLERLDRDWRHGEWDDGHSKAIQWCLTSIEDLMC